MLATLHLAWERKEFNQWLASSGRKKDQRKGSSTVKGAGACCLDGQRTGKKGELSGGCFAFCGISRRNPGRREL
jgi:hypothetical protein